MENYLVSARKYRPETFDSVVGQEAIVTTLKNAIQSGQLAQAFLFCGPRGVGKTTCARILAKTINCMNPTPNMEACGECESCLSFKNNASYNIYELDAASNSGVDDIRNLTEQVRIPPQVGNYKIYIIDEVHMLSPAAFNAFLKTLEEPPAYAKFILATTERNKILPTILSRCQIYDFKRISVDIMAKHLSKIAKQEQIDVEEQALHVVAQKADGGLRDALSMFDQLVSFSNGKVTYAAAIENLNILDYEYYFRLVDACLGTRLPELLTIYNEIMDRGFDGQNFLTGFGEHLRCLLVCQDEATMALLEQSETIANRYKDQSKQCTFPFILKALDLVNQCDFNYKNSNNRRLSIEVCLMQLGSFFLEASDDLLAEAAPQIAPAESLAMTEPALSPAPALENERPRAENNPALPDGVPTPSLSSSPPSLSSTPPPLSPEPSPVAKPKDPPDRTIEAIKDVEAPVAPLPKSTYNGGVSIKAALQKANGKGKEEELSRSSQNEPIQMDALRAAWIRYSQTLSDSCKGYFENAPLVIEGETLTVEVASCIQEYEIDGDRIPLLAYLRKELHNDFLNIKISVNAEKRVTHATTPLEIFQEMCQLNPDLEALKTSLNLGVTY